MRALLVLCLLPSLAAAETFRWSVDPIECGGFEVRSSRNRCHAGNVLVVAYPGAKVRVTRYNGTAVTAPVAWERELDMGKLEGLTIKRVNKELIEGTVTSPSATCKPKLYGGIAGDRIELEVWDGAKRGLAACTCTFQFRQAVRPESKTAIAKMRGLGEFARQAIP